MEGFFSRYRNALALVLVLTALTIGLAVQVRRPDYASRADGHNVHTVRYWAVAVFSPIERVFLAMGHGIRNTWSNYVDLRGVRRQNEKLKADLSQLRLHEAAVAEDLRQAQRLQALLAFKQQYIAKMVAAQVIGTSGSDQAHVFYIDKGSDDGLRSDMAVITPDGIVGKIRDVFPHSAQVLAINDMTSGAGVVLETTRIRGILRGTAMGGVRVANVLPDSRIKIGERILTSGGDQVYPRGLNAGQVESVSLDRDHPNYALITVKPAANLPRLEEVLVILEKDAQPPAGQQILAEAEEAPTTGARAEHLPQLKEETPEPGAPATPNLVLPRPSPVVKLDRYSPGTTPPANTLKPGAEHVDSEIVLPSRPVPEEKSIKPEEPN